MGNSLTVFNRTSKPLPIETIFKLPNPIPSWPTGEGFGSGVIDLGGLQVCEVTTFNKIWATYEDGPDNLGATFYEPTSLPEGFYMLGCYSQPNNKPLFGWALAAKDVNGNILEKPIGYTLVWTSETTKNKVGANGYIWLPTPPEGYKSVGHVVTTSPEKPSVDDKVRCVRSDFTEASEIDTWIWGLDKEIDPNGLNIYGSKPAERGTQAVGVPTGSFIVQNGGDVVLLDSLKNVQANLSAMPNLDQIEALLHHYSPLVYFHPNEQFLPSSVSWFFENGALLYTKGEEANPVPIEPPTGSNLPQGGSNDGAYWLGHPTANEKLKKGNLLDVESYVNVKPMLGATFTDLAIWVFYPFNGPARAKVGALNVSLGKIGQHVGDWEHVTLRISNFSGELRNVYFSTHSKGVWASVSQLEFGKGNKPVVYASLNGHAFFPKAGVVLQGSGQIGIRNDTAKSNNVMDTGAKFKVVSGEYLSVVEPPWLNYTREWGPRISYDIKAEIKRVQGKLPERLGSSFESVVKSLPNEILGEVGPTGPKMKSNWSGDERV